MRTPGDTYKAALGGNVLDPRFTIRVDFDDDFADAQAVLIKSHSDSGTPAGFTGTIVDARFLSGSARSVDLSKNIASIGGVSLDFLDVGKSLTGELYTKLAADYGLKSKRVVVYKGFYGHAFTDYEIVSTTISGDLSYENGRYTLESYDATFVVKNETPEIFAEVECNVTADITASATTITVDSTTGFNLIEHSDSWTDAPTYSTGTVTINGTTTVTGSGTSWNSGTQAETLYAGNRININGTDYVIDTIDSDTQITTTSAVSGSASGLSYKIYPKVGYLLIDDEIIRWRAKTATQFSGCVRGVLNTVAIDHTTRSTGTDETKLKCAEHIYIELPVIKLIYAILLGALYNQPNETIPWTAGIDTSWVANADFLNLEDLWDEDDDSTGVIAYIDGIDKKNVKEFIESQLLPMVNCFMPVYATGDIGIKRRSNVTRDAAFVAVLTDSNVVTHSQVKYTYSKILNKFIVEYNWDRKQEKYLRRETTTFVNSVTKYKLHAAPTMQLEALNGRKHTGQVLQKIISQWAQRNIEPAAEFDVELLPSMEVLEPGDVVKVRLSTLVDHTDNKANYAFDRSAEIVATQTDLLTGSVSAKLVAHGAREYDLSALVSSTATVVADAYYPDNVPSGNVVNVTNFPSYSGGTIDGETMTGSTTGMNSTDAYFYHDGDLTIGSSGLTIENNVYLRVKGFLQVNGLIDGAGNGIAGTASGRTNKNAQTKTGGVLGSAYPMRGAVYLNHDGTQSVKFQPAGEGWSFGKHRDGILPNYDLHYLSAVTKIAGLPIELRGFGGAAGGAIVDGGGTVRATGGGGGNGGAGLIILCRGIGFGVNGKIDVSGADGSVGASFGTPTYIMWGGSGSGGGPGGVLIIIDGSSHSIPGLDNDNFIANTGITPIPLQDLVTNGSFTGSASGWDYPGSWVHDATNDEMDRTGTGSTNSLKQDIATLVTNIPYQAQFTLKNRTAGSIQMGVSGGVGTARSENGTYTEYITTTTNSDLVELIPSLTFVGSVDDVKVGAGFYAHQIFVGANNYYLSRPPSNAYTKWEADSRGFGRTQRYGTSALTVQYMFTQPTVQDDDKATEPKPPTSLTVASGTSHLLKNSDGSIITRAYLTWTPTTDQTIDGYQIRYKVTAESSYTELPVPGGRSTAAMYIPGLQDAVNYTFEIRSRNIWGVYSSYATATHTTVGKTAAPTAPSTLTVTPIRGGFKITSGTVSDVDFSGYAITVAEVNDRADASAQTIYAGAVNPYQWMIGSLKTYYFWVRSYDTSGNLSAYYPSGATSGVGATSSVISSDNSYFVETFEDAENIKTELWSGWEYADIDFTASTDAEFGGRYATIDYPGGDGTQQMMLVGELIPFNPNQLYRSAVRIRDGGGTATAIINAGVMGFNYNKVEIAYDGTVGGTYFNYHAANEITGSASFKTYIGYTKGVASDGTYTDSTFLTPGKMDTTTRYIAACVEIEIGNSGGSADIDYILLEPVNDPETYQAVGSANDVYLHEALISADALDTYSAGATSTATFSGGALQITLGTGSAPTYLYKSRKVGVTHKTLSWDRRRSWESTVTPVTVGVGTDVVAAGLGFSTEFLGFGFYAGNIYAVNEGIFGGSTLSSLVGYSTGTAYKLRLMIRPGVSVEFYVNDTLYYTYTTVAGIPSGTTDAESLLMFGAYSLAGTSANSLKLSEFTFTQE